MPASIGLTITTSRTASNTVKLVLKATGIEISSKIFAIEVLPASADPENVNYRFSHVCSPMELNEFPEDEPVGGCYFRVDEIGMVFDTVEMSEHVIQNMKKDIKKLVAEYNELDSVQPTVENVSIS